MESRALSCTTFVGHHCSKLHNFLWASTAMAVSNCKLSNFIHTTYCQVCKSVNSNAADYFIKFIAPQPMRQKVHNYSSGFGHTSVVTAGPVCGYDLILDLTRNTFHKQFCTISLTASSHTQKGSNLI